jgi:hypothetical protein
LNYLSTPYNGTNGWKSVNYLDRHNVVCPAGEVLRQFKLTRNSKDNSQVRYDYTCVKAETLCCKSYTGSKQNSEDQRTYYLDRHTVGDSAKGTTQVLQQFKLFATSSGTNQLWYTWTLCKLKDMDAQIAFNTSKASVVSAQAAQDKSQTESDAAKAKDTEAQKALVKAEDAGKASQKAVDQAQKDIDAAKTRDAEAQKALVAAQAAAAATKTAVDQAQREIDAAKAKNSEAEKALVVSQSAVTASKTAAGTAQRALDDAKLMVQTNQQVSDSLGKASGLQAC